MLLKKKGWEGLRVSRLASQHVRAAVATAAVVGGMLVATSAQSAGLGRLTVQSNSGDPLRAQIEITELAPGEADSLRASLASSEIYQQTQLDRPAFLSSIQLSVADLPNGRKVVRISSDTPIDARVVDLLVELNWSTGRFIRQYSFFVDPPAQVRGAAPQNAIQVRRGDTLSGIANRVDSADARLEQVLYALLQANPSAFDGGNVNRLRSGATLNVPSADTIRSVDPAAARRALAAQQTEFQRMRSGRGNAAAVRRSGSNDNAQQASGTISATGSDRTAPVAEDRDRLRLSAAGPQRPGAGGTQGAPSAAAQQEVADRHAEELAAKDKALQEAQSRVEELERNVADMQRLLTMQNAALADAQAQAQNNAAAGAAAGTPAAGATPAPGTPAAPAADPSAPAPAPTPTPVTPGALDNTPANTAATDTPPATETAAPVAAPVEEGGLSTTQRLALLGAAILFLALLALLVARRQRERRLNALAASAALAATAAPQWVDPAPTVAATDDKTEGADHAAQVAGIAAAEHVLEREEDKNARDRFDEDDLPAASQPAPAPIDFGFDLDLDKPAPAPAQAYKETFDADDAPPPLVKSSSDVPLDPPPVTPEPVRPAPPIVPPPEPEPEPEEPLDLPEPAPAPTGPTPTFAPLLTPEPGVGVDLTEDNASKLELAEAYLEIGDREGARELLEDVAKSGTAAQQARAKETLASLK